MALAASERQDAPQELPASATSKLAACLKAATAHEHHVWRDTIPINDDGTVNGYIEIALGDRRKWEFELGPAIAGGTVVRGVIVGVVFMEDEKQQEIGDFFKRYKENQPGLFSKVPGWGTTEQGLAYVKITHAFFTECRRQTSAPCRLSR